MAESAPSHRSGFVALAGKPNVGKSTLINVLLGQKVAAVSPRPQTTRRRQLAILSREDAQLIFVDTPGLHHPRHRLGEYMNQDTVKALEDADAVLFLGDLSTPPEEEDRLVVEAIQRLKHPHPLIFGLNKVDLVSAGELAERVQAYQELLPEAPVIPFSATLGQNLDLLLSALIAALPEGPPLYDPEQITDFYERDIAADLIREAALLLLRDEVPHGIAVRIDEYKERGETGAYIAATLLVERESHKAIVIGEGGAMIKRIGSAARQEIERISGRRAYLELRVKVSKNWRDDPNTLRWLGYAPKN
jgi:GTP-binding protein Era